MGDNSQKNTTNIESEQDESISFKISAEAPIKEVGKGAFAKIPREIEEKDLKNPITAKFLLSENESLRAEKASLEPFRENYYITHERAMVAESKLQESGSFNALYAFVLPVGGVILGVVVALPVTVDPIIKWTLMICGAALILSGVIIYYRKK